jgi:hypothetical protein
LVLEGDNTTLADCYVQLLRIAAFFKSMSTEDYRTLRNSCINIFNKRYAEFDQDIYLLAFFLHPRYRGCGIRNIQFERLQKCALRIWKNLGHKKNSGKELQAQLRAYFNNETPYSASFSADHDTPYLWWNTIIDGHSSLSRLSKVIFSITPHSASCERLFSALGWLFGKRRVNLGVETLESMAKIYLYSLKSGKKDLNYTDSGSENDIKQMLNTVFEEEEFSNDDIDDDLSEPQAEVTHRTDEILNIEEIIDLGPWVLIDDSILPTINRKFNDSSDDDEDWDPEDLN